jgi:uncharacterized protein YjbJ (UPF0337 family)
MVGPVTTVTTNYCKEVPDMNKNQVKGVAKDVGGKIQQKVGEITGSSKQKVEGLEKQVEGKAQKALGDVQEIIKDRGNR